MRIKVLYVSHTPEHKGSALSLYHLLRNLDSDRYQPVAAFSKPGPLVSQLQEESIPAWTLCRRGLFGLGLIHEAYGLIKRESINLVHLNCAVPFCRYVGIAARLAGVPIVWHIREDPNGKRVRRLKAWIKMLAHRIVVVSRELEQAFSGSPKVVHIPNGVDLKAFTPEVSGSEFRRRFGIPPHAFVFGVVGSIEPRKGQLLVLEAANSLLPAHSEIWLLIVGSGLPQAEKDLTQYLDGHPAIKNITTLTGRLSGMPEVMAALDVLVLHSTWEAFPRVVIEAMAAGRPVISTPVGDVPDIMDDGVEGWLIPINDMGALMAAMSRCLTDADRLKKMGQSAASAARRYSIESHVALVQEQYEKLLSTAGFDDSRRS